MFCINEEKSFFLDKNYHFSFKKVKLFTQIYNMFTYAVDQVAKQM